MNWKDIKTLYMREMRAALRDRTIVTNSILIPIFLYPVMLWLIYTGMTFVSGQNEGIKSRVMLKDVPAVHEVLRKDLETDESIELRTAGNPESEIRDGALDALVEFLPPANGMSHESNFQARITFDESRDRSENARVRMEQIINRYRDDYLEQQAVTLGISREQFQNFWVESNNISTSRQMGQFILGLILPLFVMIMLAIGAMHPAIDATAGERENSTWETLMTLATSRTNILVAKYLYVATLSFTAAALNLFAMVFSMGAVMAPLLRTRNADISFRIPMESIPIILMGAVLMALMVAAGMMILASFARTFKEGQSAVTPLYLAIIMPIMFLQSPGLEFTPKLALIPFVNATMMFRQAIQGTYNWPLIGLTLVVEIVCIAAALKVALVIVKHEDIVMGSYGGSFGKFAKERLLRKG